MHSKQRLITLLMSQRMVYWGISSQTWIRASVSSGQSVVLLGSDT